MAISGRYGDFERQQGGLKRPHVGTREAGLDTCLLSRLWVCLPECCAQPFATPSVSYFLNEAPFLCRALGHSALVTIVGGYRAQ